MLTYRCPRCGARLSLLDRRPWQRETGRRMCPSCGAVLEMSNALLFSMLGGLVGAACTAAAIYAPWSAVHVRLIVAIPVAWFLIWLLLRYFARWTVTGQSDVAGRFPPDPPAARTWWRRMWAALALSLVPLSVNEYLLHTMGPAMARGATGSAQQAEAAWSRFVLTMHVLPVAMLLQFAALGYTIYAAWRRRRVLLEARRAHDDGPGAAGGQAGKA